MRQRRDLIGGLLILLLFLTCAREKKTVPPDAILARIGDRVLTVDEFIRRAEYTIRPSYCKLDHYIHRKIVLNSLIAEKLLALEADEDHPLRKNEAFRAYIQGRKEQAMRQLMYFEEAFQKVKLDPEEIRREFKMAGRTYRVSYLSVSDSGRAARIQDSLKTRRYDLRSLMRRIAGTDTLPQREIKWEHKEDDPIHQALFKQDVQKGQVIGPIRYERDRYLFLQIEGWTDCLALTEQSQRQRWEDARQRLHDERAGALWNEIVQKIMKNKKMEFVEDTFIKMAQIYYRMYSVSPSEMKDAFNKRFWQNQEVQNPPDDLLYDEQFLNRPFFKLDGRFWTVREFQRLVASHPLVFRKPKIKKSEFLEQFKFAVADLIRDKYVTDVAYKKGYDKRETIIQHTQMWEDAAIAWYQRDAYLKKKGVFGEFRGTERDIQRFLNLYIDSLQAKYSDRIQINIEAFEKIRLTRIDLFAKQPDQPYPILVPFFPLVTTDHRLDYGRKMNP